MACVPAHVRMGSRAAGPRRPRCGRLGAILLCSLGAANVAGKVLHLSCYGPEGDLAWTREATRDWAGVVLSRNPGPPAETVRAGSGSDLGWWGTGALLAGFAGGIAVYWWRRLSGGPLSRG